MLCAGAEALAGCRSCRLAAKEAAAGEKTACTGLHPGDSTTIYRGPVQSCAPTLVLNAAQVMA